ncbi:hypothetical protein G6F62_013687 [Rhizopus arrhizus]|nr:hypothetical protein G6F62_013687 [Rhizopus arrhizus]
MITALQVRLEIAPAVHRASQQREREEEIDEVVQRRHAFVALREEQHVDGAEGRKRQAQHGAQVRYARRHQQQRRHRDDHGEPGGNVVAAHGPQRAARNGQQRNGLIGARPEHRHPHAQADHADDVAVADLERHAERTVRQQAKAPEQGPAEKAQACEQFHGAVRTVGIGIRP